MAEPDFSVVTPDWMKQGRDVADEWLRMQAGNQNQQRLRMQQQEQDTLLPLKIRAAQQDQALQGLKITEAFKTRDELLQAEQEAQGLGDTIAPFLEKEQPIQALNALLAAGVRKPVLMKSPQWQTLVKEVQGAVTADTARKQLDSIDALRQAQATRAYSQADALDNPPDLSNITPQPILDANGNPVAFAVPNGKGGIHYVTPAQSGQVTFGVAPNGQRYVTAGKGIHLLHDAEHEAQVKVAVTGLTDVNQRIRDLESSTRLSSDERTKRLTPLLKQKADLEKLLKTSLPTMEQGQTAPITTSPVTVVPTAPVVSPFPPRPPGFTDDELKQQAEKAIKDGQRDPAWVKGALESWGVK